MCLSGTRVALLEDIWKWIQAADHTKSAEIFLLSDLAGTGKSAIAHTVANRCHDASFLASSFFFDRDIPERSGPQKLFSTITRDLSAWSKEFSERVSLVLESDPSVASASPSRQFRQLILEPSGLYRSEKPVVIVIDALDEGYDPELLEILCKEIPKLPGSFRIFLTSRPEDHIVTELSNSAHVRPRSIDIHGAINQTDIALYCENRLRYIASRKRLGAHWPGPHLSTEFQKKAEGLFIWVSTISEYLSRPKTFNPDGKLKSFLSDRNPSGLSAEAKMDELYSKILENCDWDDREFVEMYQLIVGSIMALKTPLSISALQSLHGDPALRISEILRSLSSLFTGLSEERQPVRIIHLSFRDFVTCRARSAPKFERLYVDRKTHNQWLAFLCLSILNKGLNDDIPGIDYLTKETPGINGIPTIADEYVSEGLWYACRFWSEHLVKVENPISNEFLTALRNFFSTKLVRWIEVLNSKGQFQGLCNVREWLRVSVFALT